MIKNIFEDNLIKYELIEGVLVSTYKITPVTLKIAKTIVTARLECCNGISYPVLIKEISGLKDIEKNARDYLSSDHGQTGVKAAALLAHSNFTRLIANFFLSINASKTKIPTKIFSNEKDALTWLKKYK